MASQASGEGRASRPGGHGRSARQAQRDSWLRYVSRLSALRLAFALAALLLAAPAFAAGADTTQQALEAARSTIADIETGLKADDLSDADLARLRAAADPVATDLQALVADLAPRLEASSKRLAELTPKAKDAATKDASTQNPSTQNAPAKDSASPELAAETQRHDALDADLRSARALLLQIDDIGTRISAARRNLFARRTFAQSASVASPLLWLAVAREAPDDAHALAQRVTDWFDALSTRLSLSQGLGFLAILLALIALAAPLNWMTQRVLARDASAPAPDRFPRALAAAWTSAALAAAPLVALGVFAYALDVFDISDPHLQGGLDALLDGLRLIAIVNALAHGLLSPRDANWRLVNLSDRASALLLRLWVGVAIILAFEKLLEPTADLVASLDVAVAARALGSALAALMLARTLRRMAIGAEGKGRADWGPARAALGWTLVALTIGATLAGYVAFAAYVVDQTMEAALVIATLYIVDAVIQEGAEALVRPGAAFGRGVMTAVALRRGALEQIVVLVQGFARLTIVVAGAMVILARWNLSQDFASTLRNAYFGFRIGGLTLSVSSLLIAGAALVVGVAATRALQNWLSSRYLPRTRLDAGASNSIRTIVGYVGVIVALLIGGAQLGLDSQKLAIVAGALSVGIGFGLQSIANNFVSGLILLWERGIRVGDWVVVGSETGFVRRINARATEIETLDRGMLIVPNATLVSGAVKNWMHSDRTGRIILPINVAYDSDAETMREILIAAAKAQDSVLAIPAPLALLKEFGDWSMRFELVCFVDDVVTAERVRSEMSFDILRRMREAGLRIPYPK
ncbi:MAG: mechanosensitive ion channel family protein [Bradyrhizobium sp.]|nr:MAG: mechanosensitive ion channel family protein [Bradyrhizobium sp.]